MPLDDPTGNSPEPDEISNTSTGKVIRVADESKLQKIHIRNLNEMRTVFRDLGSEEAVVVSYEVSGKKEYRWIDSRPELERFFRLYATKNTQGDGRA